MTHSRLFPVSIFLAHRHLWLKLWLSAVAFLFMSSLAYSTTPSKENLLKPAYILVQMGNGKIHIDGMVSSQEERDVLVKAVAKRIGDNNIIDTLKISDKVSRADWISKIKDLVGTMVEGVSLSVKEGDIQLTGNIDGTKARYKAVKQLTNTSAKSGLNIDNQIDITSVSSVLKISKRSDNAANSAVNSVILKGEMPSQTHIDTLIDASKKTFGSPAVINKITISDKAIEPKWLQTIAQLIPELKNLKDGSLVASDQSLTITGLFESEDARTRLHGKIIKVLNADFKGQVAVKALKPASFNLRMGNGMIHIDGTVSSEEERNTLLKSAITRVGSENVINTIKVSEKTTLADWIDEIAVLTESYIEGGWFSVKNKEVSLMGSVDSPRAHQQTINRFKLALTDSDIKVVDHIKVDLVDSETAAPSDAFEPVSEPEVTDVTQSEAAPETVTKTVTENIESDPESEAISESKPVVVAAQETEVVQESVPEARTQPKPEISENEKIKTVCQGMIDHSMKNNTIRFSTNSAIIRVKSYPLLDNLSSVLKECEVVIADKGVTIAGHTDSRGDAAYNMSLSQRRADSVEKYLRKADVHSTLITTIGYGEEQPVVSEETAENKADARAQNRRITIQIKRKQ